MLNDYITVDITVERPNGHPVIQKIKNSYKRMRAEEFLDKSARLTPRQAVFLRNLISLAQTLGSARIPIEFELSGEGPVHLDRGCVKIAEHSGFIRPLENGDEGFVEAVELSFSISA